MTSPSKKGRHSRERERERESNTPSTSDALPVYQLRLSRCRQRERGGSRGGGRKEKKSGGTISFFSFAPPVPIHPFPPTGTERGEGAPGLRCAHTHINTPSVTTATSARRRSGQRERTHGRLKITGSSTQVSAFPK